MTPEQGNIVQATWKQIHPVRGFASGLFYFVLFRVDPYSRRLFHGDARSEEERFVEVLGAIVGQVGGGSPADTATHGAADRGVAACSVADRLLTSHRAAVRIALLRVLRQVLGSAYAPALEGAWLAALDAAADGLSTRRRSGRNASARPAKGKPAAIVPRVRVPSAPGAKHRAV